MAGCVRVEVQTRDLWTTGTVIRVNRKTVRCRLNFDVYQNGNREETYPTARVFLQSDRPVPFPVGMDPETVRGIRGTR